MKKNLIFFLIFILIILFFIFKKINFFSKEMIDYKIGDKNYKLLVADNKSKWQKGLMFYKSKKELKGADGMIFIFPNKDYRSFWNDNTYLDLKIYWLVDDKIVKEDKLPSILKTKEIYIINSPVPVDKVIEIVE